VRRTQLYLDDDLWNALHAQARRESSTISELVRRAARECYLGRLDERRRAMEAFIGIRRDLADTSDAAGEVRRLRKGTRLERL
jgi:hypothetical protein